MHKHDYKQIIHFFLHILENGQKSKMAAIYDRN